MVLPFYFEKAIKLKPFFHDKVIVNISGLIAESHSNHFRFEASSYRLRNIVYIRRSRTLFARGLTNNLTINQRQFNCV